MISVSGARSSASAEGKPSTRTAASLAYTSEPSGPWAVTASAMPSRIERRSSATSRSPSWAARSSVTSSQVTSATPSIVSALTRSVRTPRGVSHATVVPRRRSPRAARTAGSCSSASGRPSASRQRSAGSQAAAEPPTGSSPLSSRAARLAASTRPVPGSTATTAAGIPSSIALVQRTWDPLDADADCPLTRGSLFPGRRAHASATSRRRARSRRRRARRRRRAPS